MRLSNNQQAFLALVRAGLWEKEVRLSQFETIDFNEVYRLAEEQSVVGLVAAGLEHVVDMKPPKKDVLQFVGQTLQLEQRNTAMNYFIGVIIEKMRANDIRAILVKGQGVAQCYEKPLWRSSGDVDFLFGESDYNKAKDFLLPLASGNKKDERYSKHLGMNIDPWYVEIHGTMRTGLSGRVDKVVDDTVRDVLSGNKVRTWMNDDTQVFLPAADEDVILVFTHFIKHFYKEGMNLRQVCDWCRLLWTYKDSVNRRYIESRIQKAGLLSEWKAFASLAVTHLGMPEAVMPMYEADKKWAEKAQRIVRFILCDYKHKIVADTYTTSKIFPSNTMRFLPSILFKVNWLKIKERILAHDNN